KLSLLDEQTDIVLGKEKRVLALLDTVSTWYTINPDNPAALAASVELRTYSSSLIHEDTKLVAMLQNTVTPSCLANNTLLKRITHSSALMNEIASQVRQLS